MPEKNVSSKTSQFILFLFCVIIFTAVVIRIIFLFKGWPTRKEALTDPYFNSIDPKVFFEKKGLPFSEISGIYNFLPADNIEAAGTVRIFSEENDVTFVINAFLPDILLDFNYIAWTSNKSSQELKRLGILEKDSRNDDYFFTSKISADRGFDEIFISLDKKDNTAVPGKIILQARIKSVDKQRQAM